MALRKLICEFLKKRGYRVLEAKDGVSASLKIKRYPGPIDLLLTDVMIPTISGFELATRLRERRPSARALFITGHTEDAIRRLPHWQEGVEVLKKPFSLNALAQTYTGHSTAALLAGVQRVTVWGTSNTQ
ncbi:MAG: response regulator [Acidobacteria bacterium]|nr:response regulator [Acidobacteriota bacterium]